MLGASESRLGGDEGVSDHFCELINGCDLAVIWQTNSSVMLPHCFSSIQGECQDQPEKVGAQRA
jgi:hypothetical protein